MSRGIINVFGQQKEDSLLAHLFALSTYLYLHSTFYEFYSELMEIISLT